MNLLLAVTLIAAADAAAPVFFEELVFPPEPMHNHSSSIVETPNGDLLVAWFHGRGEKTDDTLVINGARRRIDADKWSKPFVMADNQNLPDQNSVLYIDPDGRLYLWWISSLANTRETYLLQYRTATAYEADGPPTWEWNDTIMCRPKNLVAVMDKISAGVDAKFDKMFDFEEKYRKRLEHGLRMARIDDTYMTDWQDRVWGRLTGMLTWMPRCQPIMLSDNRMMIGLYSDVYCTSLSCFTEDGGKTWEYGEPMADYGLIQPAFIQKKDGTIIAYGRDKGPLRYIRVAESTDGGLTWGNFHDLKIRNPESSVSVTKLQNGHWILLCNDLDGRDGRHGRSRLTAYISDNEGATWKWRRNIEDNHRPPDDNPHASYPTVIQTRNGMIHVTFTYTPKPNETIKHVWFNEEWVKEGEN